MRRQLTLAFATIALAACADSTAPTVREDASVPRPAMAVRSNRWFPVAGTIYDRCTGEYVALEGRFHQVVSVNESGTESTVHINSDALHGVGLTSGDRYVYHTQRTQQSVVTSNPYTQTVEFSARYQVISQGSKDNWFATLSYRYTYPPGTFQITSNESECRG